MGNFSHHIYIRYIISGNLVAFRLQLQLFKTATDTCLLILRTAADLCLPFVTLSGSIVKHQTDCCHSVYCNL